MPTNRLVNTNFSFLQRASEGMLSVSTPSNYGNATSKVINLNNNNWLGDSVVFTVDSAWRYVVHVRNTKNGASSIHIDDVRVYGMNTATYLACDTASGGYRFGFNSMPKDNEIYGPEGSGYDFGARIYDSRIARFLSVDPKFNKYPSLSSYNFVGNSPLAFIDPDGKEIVPIIHKDSKGNITTIELIVTGKIIFKGIYYSEKRQQEIAGNINSNISSTWNMTTSEDIPKEWQNADGSPITFKVTAKLEVMKDGEVLDECDHVIYMVDFMPNQNAEKTVGGSVNAIGGMQMYMTDPKKNYDHELGHWMGLYHPDDFEEQLNYYNDHMGKNIDVPYVLNKTYGIDNVMNETGGTTVTPMQFYISTKLLGNNLLNSGDNGYYTKDNWKDASRGTSGALIIHNAVDAVEKE